MSRKRVVSVLLFFLLVGILAMVVSNTPSKGKIVKTELVAKEVVMENKQKYSDEFLNFEYQNKYKLEVVESHGKKVLKNIHLVGNGGVIVDWVIVLSDSDARSLEDVSGVTMRQVKSDEYIQEKIKMNVYTGVRFTKNNPFEITAFFLDKGRSLTISVVVNSNETENYKKEFIELVNSINLK